eukprot:4396780-Amphidinium_carterae.1
MVLPTLANFGLHGLFCASGAPARACFLLLRVRVTAVCVCVCVCACARARAIYGRVVARMLQYTMCARVCARPSAILGVKPHTTLKTTHPITRGFVKNQDVRIGPCHVPSCLLVRAPQCHRHDAWFQSQVLVRYVHIAE